MNRRQVFGRDCFLSRCDAVIDSFTINLDNDISFRIRESCFLLVRQLRRYDYASATKVPVLSYKLCEISRALIKPDTRPPKDSTPDLVVAKGIST